MNWQGILKSFLSMLGTGWSGPRFVEAFKSVAEVIKMYHDMRNRSPTRRNSRNRGSTSKEVAITMLTLWGFWFLTAIFCGLFGAVYLAPYLGTVPASPDTGHYPLGWISTLAPDAVMYNRTF